MKRFIASSLVTIATTLVFSFMFVPMGEIVAISPILFMLYWGLFSFYWGFFGMVKMKPITIGCLIEIALWVSFLIRITAVFLPFILSAMYHLEREYEKAIYFILLAIFIQMPLPAGFWEKKR